MLYGGGRGTQGKRADPLKYQGVPSWLPAQRGHVACQCGHHQHHQAEEGTEPKDWLSLPEGEGRKER